MTSAAVNSYVARIQTSDHRGAQIILQLSSSGVYTNWGLRCRDGAGGWRFYESHDGVKWIDNW